MRVGIYICPRDAKSISPLSSRRRRTHVAVACAGSMRWRLAVPEVTRGWWWVRAKRLCDSDVWSWRGMHTCNVACTVASVVSATLKDKVTTRSCFVASCASVLVSPGVTIHLGHGMQHYIHIMLACVWAYTYALGMPRVSRRSALDAGARTSRLHALARCAGGLQSLLARRALAR
jgi:hypothetical protein